MNWHQNVCVGGIATSEPYDVIVGMSCCNNEKHLYKMNIP